MMLRISILAACLFGMTSLFADIDAHRALSRLRAFHVEHRGQEGVENVQKTITGTNRLSCIVYPKDAKFEKRRKNLLELGKVLVGDRMPETDCSVAVIDKVSAGILHSGVLLGQDGLLCINLTGRYCGYVRYENIDPDEFVIADNTIFFMSDAQKMVGLECNGMKDGTDFLCEYFKKAIRVLRH